MEKKISNQMLQKMYNQMEQKRKEILISQKEIKKDVKQFEAKFQSGLIKK